jgi:hypothetical protein
VVPTAYSIPMSFFSVRVRQTMQVLLLCVPLASRGKLMPSNRTSRSKLLGRGLKFVSSRHCVTRPARVAMTVALVVPSDGGDWPCWLCA